MRIQIRLYGPLSKYSHTADLHELEIPEGITLHNLAGSLHIPASAIAFFVVNGVKAAKDYLLQENDTVKVFPWVAGG